MNKGVKQSDNQSTQLPELTQKTLSVRYILILLCMTATVLMVIYYKSILIYWQQTYHFDLIHANVNSDSDADSDPDADFDSDSNSDSDTMANIQSDTLIVDDTSLQKLEQETNQEQDNQETVAMSENSDLTKSEKQVVHTIKQSKSKPAKLYFKNKTVEKDKDNQTQTNTQQQIAVNQPLIIDSKALTQRAKHDKNKVVSTEKTESLPTKTTDILLSYHPFPIQLTDNDKVFFAGDSLMQGVAPYVKKMLFKQYKIESLDLSKQSTGLAYPSAFDWPKTINDNLVADPSIKLLVVFLGPNDPWDFPVKGYSKYARFKSELWEQQYRMRIATILNNAKEHHVQVLWLAAPCMRKPKLNEGMVYLNFLYKSELEKAQQHFLTTNDLLGCSYEKFSNFVETGKEKTKVRVDDGIHFTPTGQKILAKAIMEKITYKKLEDTHSD
ncbi:hypothetical protein A9G11_13635 [Gilliamella sp. wkB108]|uniref:SGNH/GDSL hydrolase family protein n=1 Tax=Gilliamella sp. wkB108 TaxID=3120256 RepID=UPI00080DB377|nr:SGNH/GDSL hydrolase family protein [Gilliamella apicola]OCG26607.1 hypothetical protein A9G11_13635 [Gilliamella apicola]